MYFQALDASAEIRSDLIEIVRMTGAAYARALSRAHADKPLSERGSAAYLEIRKARRADLEAMVRAGLPDACLSKARDVICAICEESAWAEQPEFPFEDDMHPTIDHMAAQTACLLAWAKQAGKLDARTESRMLFEARKRIFTPLIAHEDYPCMKGDAPVSLATVCEALSAALLLESDGPRLYMFLRRASRAADDLIDAQAPAPLADALKDRAAATALWALARGMAGPSALGRPLPKPEWLDELLMAHLGGAVFIDPAGAGTRTGLNGANVFLMGAIAGDDAVCALGAQLHRQNPEDATSVTALMLYDIGGIAQVTDAVPRLRHAALPDGSLLSARGGGMLAMLHAGGRKNAGGVCIYIENAPILVPSAGDAPILNGVTQTAGRALGDCDFGDTRADLTMDMTALYPQSGARFFQRTLMLDRTSGTARIVDIAESASPGEIRYTFFTPQAPVRTGESMRLGVALMTWDGAPEVSIRRAEGAGAFPGRLHVIELTFPILPGTNLVNFILERA